MSPDLARRGLPHFSTCVSWPCEKLEALEWLVDNGIETTRPAFLERVAPGAMRRIEKVLGYASRQGRGLLMAEDPHVRYFRSPDGAVAWFVHSAIEYVFALERDIDQIQEVAMTEILIGPVDPNDMLILVHPGSLYGSAEANVGKFEARAAREEILETLIAHDGSVLVIDGALSDEIPPADTAIIEGAILAARERGCYGIRAWGCDSGEPPFANWLEICAERDDAAPLIAGSQEEVIALLSSRIDANIPSLTASVTGAWASSGESGCVNSVAAAFEAQGASVRILDCALREPDEFEEEPETP